VPGLALIVGSLVACVALAMYLPLLRLMDTLSNSLTWTP